jgi:translocation and assembly module TamA
MTISCQRYALRAALSLSLFALFPGPAVGQEAVPPPAPTEAPLDPASPMAELPDIGVAWPDMSESLGSTKASPDQAASAEQDDDADRRYSVELEGLEKLNAAPVRTRFEALSVLKQGEGKPANSAQIDRRIREDRDLLDSILRASGHYDAQVDSAVETGANGKLLVKLTIIPGPLYTFQQVTIEGLETTGAKAVEFGTLFGVEEKDPVDADDVLGGQSALERQLKLSGYPFAKVAEPEVTVDHDTRSGTLALKVETGGERKFADILLKGEKLPFDAAHVATIARFKRGDPFDQAKLEDLKRGLIATGLAGAVDVTPVPGAAPDAADIAVSLEPAPPRTIAGEAGYGTGEGFRVEASWTHRNFIRPEGALTVRGIAGTREQLAAVSLRQSNFRARDHVLSAQIAASHLNRNAYDARTLRLSAGLERQSTIIWQKKWIWSFGAELLASDERDVTARGFAQRQTYVIGALPLSLGYDRSDDLLDPTRGFRLAARISPEASLRQGSSFYLRTQIDGSAYLPAGKRVVLAGRVRLGTLAGAKTLTIAPSRRFYSGGGGSVRGFGYQQIGPRDAFNDPVGGRSLAEFSLEARVRFGNFGVVPFIDAGNIYSSQFPDFSKFRYGAGVGVRYHSSFGPIRIDVGTPINPQKGDTPVTVFVSLGQAF